MNNLIVERCCESVIERLRRHARQPAGVSLKYSSKPGAKSIIVLSFDDGSISDERAVLQVHLHYGSIQSKLALYETETLQGSPYTYPDKISAADKTLTCEYLGAMLVRPRVLQIYRGITGAELATVRYVGTGSEQDIVLSTERHFVERLVKRRVSSIELPSICVTDPTECLLHAYEIAVQCNERALRKAG